MTDPRKVKKGLKQQNPKVDIAKNNPMNKSFDPATLNKNQSTAQSGAQQTIDAGYTSAVPKNMTMMQVPETPKNSDENGLHGMPRCDGGGKPIHWQLTGRGSNIPQVGPGRAFGMDCSGWNRPSRTPMKKFAKEGVSFMIIKIQEGDSASNKFRDIHMKGCRDAGIKVGVYHYPVVANRDGVRLPGRSDWKKRSEKEFRILKSEIKRLESEYGKLDIVPALDMERTAALAAYGNRGGQKRGVTEAIWNCKYYTHFCKMLNDTYGGSIIYSASWARNLFLWSGVNTDEAALLAKTTKGLWWAEYDGTKNRTKRRPTGRKGRGFKPWKTYDIWQFTGYGRFQALGGRGRFDFNSFKQSSLRKLRRR